MKRHIVQVSAYYPPNLGGQENAVHDLSAQLAAAEHPVDVLTSAAGGGPQGVTLEQGIRVRRLPGYVFGHAPIMPGFGRALRRTIQPGSVVHLHIGQAFTPEMVWLSSKLRPFPYVAELHIDFRPSGKAGILLPLYKRLVLQRVLQAATVVVVLNEETLRAVRETYGRQGRTLVLHNGIDESYFLIKRRAAVSPPPTLRLLFVGRLSKQKNIPSLVRALQLVRRPVHLDLIGDGEERESVRQLIVQSSIKNVTLHGRLDRKEVQAYYKTCDVLVMPSLYEAQPLVLLEAMAARIPIIGTNVTGVEEHIKDAGIVVDPTPQGLADGIDAYDRQYPSVQQLVERAYARAEQRRWRYLLKQYEALYEEAAA
ncbi:MAG TPA: glycosyltransferase family 4 protein [Candidatus Saccharimonadales bacterium]|nr:glycosyltransferase family 4 protein [Candidatus Saccharimonadales bacterium]